MLLIADSGSTKCDWMLVDNNEQRTSFSTMGFNPFFHDKDLIVKELLESDLKSFADKVKFVFFFGAGCSSRELKATVERALSEVFHNAHIYVDHDLVAAAFATYDGRAAISCILGTGSNSCFFDGDIVSEEVPALAYILGDEGSGSYFGKKLLQLYLYKKLPQHLDSAFKKRYNNLSKNEIFENVYRKPHANVYLASFMRFVSDNKNDPFIRKIIFEGMQEFIKTHVMCFKYYNEVPVHFIGSVAFFCEDILREAANELGINVGNIIQRPIDGLVNYYLHYHKSKLLV